MSFIGDAFIWLFGGAGIVALGAAWRWWRSRRPTPPLPRPVPRVVSPTIGQLKERARVLVVDDQTFEYQSALQQDGFHVEWVRDLESTTEIEQGSFDVVLLDLHGVATTISPKQGIGALTQIKRASPAQMVVAYSSAAWPVTESREIGVADVVLDKAQAAFPDFREAVVKLLLRSADVSHYLAALDSMCTHALDRLLGDRLGGLHAETRACLLRYVASGSREDLAELAASLQERGLDRSSEPQVHSVANLARRRLSPWLT